MKNKRNQKEKRAVVCPRCGNSELKWSGGGAKAVFDYTGVTSMSGLKFCPQCGQDVLPIEVSDIKEYTRFLQEGKPKPVTAEKVQKERKERPINLAGGFIITCLFAVFLAVFVSLLMLLVLQGADFLQITALFLVGAGIFAFLYFRLMKKEKK